jgi:hypothetical protein
MNILHIVGYIIIALVLLLPGIAMGLVLRNWWIPLIAYPIVAAFLGIVYFSLMLINS